ncbi:alkylhydroperoxidase AhpD family core domain-containing protein [Amphritea atlantica]|uniref:Alkylhydroperoxidase AhpD family core domain-containing protein n=1 Tax=Amphritea atlantica TaxID=355243 RepID=A0A1H9GPY9_9GAMM|nr:carboxymuconolactone decarboxylase family protein [Amphritea atlantica]SEQ52207.1 alkylhydroperoxidase AhpD family core domain-containing protein [Amphritea atlantica]
MSSKTILHPPEAPLPKTFTRIMGRYPDYAAAVEQLGKAVRDAGPIDEKTAQLIQLAAAASIRSEGALHSHVRRARQAGATTEEIQHTLILLTSTIGLPTVMAALSWMEE